MRTTKELLWFITAVILMFCFFMCSVMITRSRAEEWSPYSIAFAVTGTALTAQDWAMTRWRCSHAEQVNRSDSQDCEGNPLLGERPSPAQINTAAIVGLAIGLGGAFLIEHDDARMIWLFMWSFLEFSAVNEHYAFRDKGSVFGTSFSTRF